MIGLLAVFAGSVLPHLKIETDILALLPNEQQDRAMDAALDAFSADLARKQIFLVGAAQLNDAQVAAKRFANELDASHAFSSVELELNADLRQRFGTYLRHRGYLLAPQDERTLRAGDTDAIKQQALRAAFTPAGLIQPLSLAEDPLGLLNRFMSAQIPALGNAHIDGSMLVIENANTHYVVIVAECDGSPFASATHARVIPAMNNAVAAAKSSVAAKIDIVSSGAIRHAAAATERATAEISTFGTIETIGVIALLWSVFGALRPLGLGALTLGLATVASLTAVHFIFGTMHILALVFGSSLIGGVIDYSVHFFADRFRNPKNWTPVEAVQHVGGAILLGLITTLIGYVVLILVPFPGLKQIAVFCAVGLAVGCGCVLCLYPVLASPGRKAPPMFGPRIGVAIDDFMARWRWTPLRVGVATVAAAAVLFGLTRAQIQDDVRALQQSPPELVRDEQRVRELLGSGVETRFYLVTGESEQALLGNERALTRQLDRLIARRAISSYQAVSAGLSSLQHQQEIHRLLTEKVYARKGLLEQTMAALGFPTSAIDKRRREFAADEPLTVDEWLASPASQAARHLWLGKVTDRYASVVTLGGIEDIAALSQAAAAQPHVRLIDRVASTSDILSRYRRTMSALLAIIYLVAGVVLAVRFGWRDAPRMLAPSAAATAMTLGAFGWFGVPINLFTLLALWLVLGMGIDYGIFLRHGATSRPTAILSVTLSACTTLLAFGLLAFSATPFIRSIGLTLLCAIMMSWLFVLFSCLTGSQSQTKEPQEIPHG